MQLEPRVVLKTERRGTDRLLAPCPVRDDLLIGEAEHDRTGSRGIRVAATIAGKCQGVRVVFAAVDLDEDPRADDVQIDAAYPGQPYLLYDPIAQSRQTLADDRLETRVAPGAGS